MVKKTEYKIYTERECKEEPYRKKVQLFGYVVGENAPVVLICPGGAYKFISDFNEGEPFAREFNKRGKMPLCFFTAWATTRGIRAPLKMWQEVCSS